MSNNPGGLRSVERAINVLEVLAARGEAGVSEVAAEIDVHKSTAFRLLGALEARGLVEQATERGKYRLGFGIVRLAGAVTGRLDITQQGREVCERLSEEIGETVNIAVLAHRSALYVDQVSGGSGLQSHNWVGQHIPLHATSNGKILLSELDEARLNQVLGTLARYAARTITKKSALLRDLAEVRERGYAVAIDELEQGLTAVAAPIRNAHGDIIASMSVSGASFRLRGEVLEAAVHELVSAAAEVSFRLGWNDHLG